LGVQPVSELRCGPMNRTFRTVLVLLAGASAAALAAACSSSSGSPEASYGEACSVYTVGQACSGSLLCRCALTTYAPDVNPCFCTYSCDSPDTCPNDAGSCLSADDPSQPTVENGYFCFNILPDGGPL
jgi:hypothetical protein